MPGATCAWPAGSKSTDPAQLAAEDLPEEIPDLVAEILARSVEQRQRRQLSTAFRQRQAVLSRVRGRIDHLTTSRQQLLAKGQVACRFEELTVDSPRNRYVRTALESVQQLCTCTVTVLTVWALGAVTVSRPSRYTA